MSRRPNRHSELGDTADNQNGGGGGGEVLQRSQRERLEKERPQAESERNRIQDTGHRGSNGKRQKEARWRWKLKGKPVTEQDNHLLTDPDEEAHDLFNKQPGMNINRNKLSI